MATSVARILCVSDDPARLRPLETMLRQGGYDFMKAATGREALEIVKADFVDLVISDTHLPHGGGFNLCRTIKSDETMRAIPVVLIASLLNPYKDRVRGIEAGVDNFIIEPLDEQEVIPRIKNLLEIKAHSDKITCAYNHMRTISGAGDKLLNKMNLGMDDFTGQIEYMIAQVMCSGTGRLHKPEIMLLCIDNNKATVWFKYWALGGAMGKDILSTKILSAAKSTSTEASIFNDGSTAKQFLSRLGIYERIKDEVTVENMACFVNKEMSVFAINYGGAVSRFDAEVLESLVVHSMFMKSLHAQMRQTEDAYEYMVYSLARAAEVHDEDTGNHILRIGEFCGALAGELKMPKSFINKIRLKATLHDIGKIHTPAAILRKPGRLNPSEFEIIKQHTLLGAQIIGNHPRLSMAKVIALSHHEKWDGSGYPHGLKGKQIPIEGRIVALADNYDALRTKRSYKEAFDHQTAMHIITQGDGRVSPQHFDPAVINAFGNAEARFREIYERLDDHAVLKSNDAHCAPDRPGIVRQHINGDPVAVR